MNPTAVDGVEIGLDEYELLLEAAVSSALRHHTLVGFVTRILANRASILRADSRKRIAAAIIEYPGPSTSPEDEVVWRHALRALEQAARNDDGGSSEPEEAGGSST